MASSRRFSWRCLHLLAAAAVCGLLFLPGCSNLRSGGIAGNGQSPAEPGFLGVSVSDFTVSYARDVKNDPAVAGGVLRIERIFPGTAADRSALREGDLLVAINGTPLPPDQTVENFGRSIRTFAKGDVVTISGFSPQIFLFENGLAQPPGRYAETLARVFDHPKRLQNATVERKIKLEPFEYALTLGSRNDPRLKRELPPLLVLPPDAPSEARWMKVPASEDFDAFLQHAERAVTDIREDAFAPVPGVVALEADLHRQPQHILTIGRQIATRLYTDPFDALLASLFTYLETLPDTPIELPDLPVTPEQAIGQLAEFLSRKKAFERRFIRPDDAFDDAHIEALLHYAHSAYVSSDKPAAAVFEPAFNGKNLVRQFQHLEARIDYGAMRDAGRYLLRFFSNQRLARLHRLLADLAGRTVELEGGGTLCVGSPDDDLHIAAADLIIDFGGNDTYLSLHPENRKAVIIDFDGNDLYRSAVPFEFAAGFRKLAFLLDRAGNDTYQALDGSLAAGMGGLGILVDQAGDDLYVAQQSSLGSGLFGAGILLDEAGTDRYVSAYFSQGVGMTGGIGTLLDRGGNDSYQSQGGKASSYAEAGLYDGLSQGVGIGLRGIARGGIGILADLSGDDAYRSGNFSQGTGYYFGTGILFDAQGNDRYHCSRYGQGAAAHSASGIFIDSQGDDLYRADIHAIGGAAWDLSTALFYDGDGDDAYHSPSAFSFGAADHSALAYHYDMGGDDHYGDHFYSSQTNAYHGGHSAGHFLNLGGRDRYPAPYSDDQRLIVNEFLFVDRTP